MREYVGKREEGNERGQEMARDEKKKFENNYVDCSVDSLCNGNHRRTPPTVLFRSFSRTRFIGQCYMVCVFVVN